MISGGDNPYDVHDAKLSSSVTAHEISNTLCILNMGYFKFIVGNQKFFLMFMNIIIFGECQNTKQDSASVFCGKTDCELPANSNLIKYNNIKQGGIIMARTANVFARVEPDLKEQAEQVLNQLGIPMSNAVGMFLKQIVLQRGIPFEMKLPSYEEPIAYRALTKEQFNAEIEKGMEDIKTGKVYSADEIEAEMKREFGL